MREFIAQKRAAIARAGGNAGDIVIDDPAAGKHVEEKETDK